MFKCVCMPRSLTVTLLALATALPLAAGDLPLPAEGTRAPGFILPAQDGSPLSLDQLRGKWVVLFFYPRDFSSGCTAEVRNFQRDLEKYHARNAEIVGVSLDSVDSHRKFCEKERLAYELLSDARHRVAQSYGSLREWNGKEYAARNTFLIDPAGRIRKVYAQVNPEEHSDQVLADLDSIQSAR